MPTNRDPANVIRRLLEVIPDEKTELRARLAKLREDSWYHPPENKTLIWEQLRDTLVMEFGDKRPAGWAMLVSEIVRGVRE